jgi:hypothetical protein
MFTLILGFSALFIAGCAAYFSVLGIATLFSGSFLQVIIMASSLELGKLVATSYLYRYWNKTTWWLKMYLGTAVCILMAVTSMGIFGYLSAAYQANSGKFEIIDNKIQLIENQKTALDTEIDQLSKRVQTLNDIRASQEQRVQQAGNYKAPREQAYAAIEKANEEIKDITEKLQATREQRFQKDNEIILLNQETGKAKDIGTFKFVAQSVNKPLDSVVIIFICILICVFDPLAVSLILAFNVASTGKMLKEKPVTPVIPSSAEKEPELILETQKEEEEEVTVEPEAPGLEPAEEHLMSDQTEETKNNHNVAPSSKKDGTVIGKIKAKGFFKPKQ